MAKNCESQGFVINADQISKLKDQDVIYVSVTDNLASCVKIDARTINKSLTNMDAATSIYNAANVPNDSYGCSKNKCYNTGTFQGAVATAKEEVVIGDFRKNFDASLYLGGLVTAYVLLPDGDHDVTLEIANYTETEWTNSNSIKVTVHATKGVGGSALYPVTFDLGDLTQTNGTGWTGDTIGAVLRVHIAGANLAANDLVGVSSFAFYESIEDLQINNTILFTCVNTWGDNQTFDVIEGQCSQSEYNSNSGSMTFNMTVNKKTENYRTLNPTYHEDDTNEFGIPHIVTRQVQAGTGELADYGVIQLSDMVDGDCGFLYIQTPGCANNSSALTRVSSPVPVKFDAENFQVLTTDYNGVQNQGTILVDKQWVGQELNVIYRQTHTAKVSKITNEFRDFNVNIMAPLRKKNGDIEWHYYENAFMTADANAISRTDETSMDITFTVAADENGVKKQIVNPLD